MKGRYLTSNKMGGSDRKKLLIDNKEICYHGVSAMTRAFNEHGCNHKIVHFMFFKSTCKFRALLTRCPKCNYREQTNTYTSFIHGGRHVMVYHNTTRVVRALDRLRQGFVLPDMFFIEEEIV